jgi:hypothetical protein
MKKNLIASVMLAFATVFALADNLGTTTKVGSLSRSTDYVYTADQADALFGARVPTNRTVNGHALTGNVTVTASDIGVEAGANLGFNAISGTTGEPVNVQAGRTALVFEGSNASVSVGTSNTGYPKVTISVPDGTTGAKGVVQLSSATNSTSEALAATPKAVKTALEAANAHADAKAAAAAYTHPTYTARTGKPTANATPTFGGNFTVSQITSDSTGHVTGATDRTITIPSTTATTSAAGLMSAADKTALDSLSAGAVTKSSITAALQAQGITSADTMDDMDTLAAKVAAIIAVLEAID